MCCFCVCAGFYYHRLCCPLWILPLIAKMLAHYYNALNSPQVHPSNRSIFRPFEHLFSGQLLPNSSIDALAQRDAYGSDFSDPIGMPRKKIPGRTYSIGALDENIPPCCTSWNGLAGLHWTQYRLPFRSGSWLLLTTTEWFSSELAGSKFGNSLSVCQH